MSEAGLGFLIRGALLGLIPWHKRLRSSIQSRNVDIPKRLRLSMERLGPTFVKFGQVLSTRPDLVPKDWALEFGKLQDSVAPMPWSDAKLVVEQELGGSLKKIFADFSKTPLASASIGQVHRARLKSGESVVVKVQRLNIVKDLECDIDILLFLAREIVKHFPETSGYDPVGIVNEFAEWTRKELDYSLEGSHAEILAEHFSGDKNLVVPKVFWEYSTRKVLTMSFVNGVKVSSIPAAQKKKFGSVIAKRAVNIYLKQIFEHGYFHGDPHPANIFVVKGNKIALLDYGIVGTFSPTLRKKLVKIFIALVRNDSEGLVDGFLSLSGNSGNVDRDEYLRDVADFLSSWSVNVKSPHFSSSRTFFDLTSMAVHHGVKMLMDVVILGKALITVDTVAKNLDKNFIFMEVLRPYVEELVREQYSPKNIGSEIIDSLIKIRDQAVEVPMVTKRLLDTLERGELKVGVDKSELSSYESEKHKDSAIISMGIIFTGFVITGALTSNTGAQIFGFGISSSSFVLATIVLLMLAFYVKKNTR